MKHAIPPGKLPEVHQEPARTYESVARIICAGREFFFYRKINDEGLAYDCLFWNEAPVAAIGALVAVIAHHKVHVAGHHQFTVQDVPRQRRMPCMIHVAGGVSVDGEVIAIIVEASDSVNHVIFVKRFSVDEYDSFAQPDPVSGPAKGAFHE